MKTKGICMALSVRKATLNDYGALCKLIDEIDALHRDNLPHVFQKPIGPVREQEYYSGLISDEGVGLFVAETGKKLIGFVHAIIRDTQTIPVLVFVPRLYAVVESIAVKSEFRSHGIGRMLMDKMQEWAIAKSATSIELNVYEFNETAISFYERLGFQTFSRKMSKEFNLNETAA
jgi:diamine N-acetyltransferase